MGTYYNETSKTCSACPPGSYQNDIGKLSCITCPLIGSKTGVTVGPGARSANECKGNFGTFSIS